MSVNTVKQDGSLLRVAGGTLYADAPIGSIQAYGGTTAPSGWLLCQGQAVSRTEYAELFAVIGIAFGTGDGSSTFNVPDLREATTKGVGLSGKGDQSGSNHYDYDDGGVVLGEFIENRNKSHYHNVYVRDTGHAHGIDYENGQFTPGAYGFMTPYLQSGGNSSTRGDTAKIQVNQTPSFNGLADATAYSGSQTAEVKAVGVNYIIKAKQVAVPFDVAEYIRNQNVLSDLEGWTGLDSPMPYDGIIYLTTHSDINYPRIKIYMNSEIVAEAGYNASSNTVVQCDSIPFMKGDIFSITGGEGLMSGYIRFYKLRDYTGR